MDTKSTIRLGARRLAWLFVISLVAVGLVSESAFLLQKEDTDRAPKTVELVIPDGASARVAVGEVVSAIPEEMTFVLGDTLLVRNNDSVDHQLGPLWVPAGSSASILLEQAEKFAYSCSFQPTQYLGLNVVKPTTWVTRVIALALATPPTTVFLFVYSILIWPLQPKGQADNLPDRPGEGDVQVEA